MKDLIAVVAESPWASVTVMLWMLLMARITLDELAKAISRWRNPLVYPSIKQARVDIQNLLAIIDSYGGESEIDEEDTAIIETTRLAWVKS